MRRTSALTGLGVTGAGRLFARRFAVLAVLCAFAAHGARAEPSCAEDAEGTYSVVKVIDSETLLLDDGQEVRLIGALTPTFDTLQKVSPDSALAGEAKRALEALVSARAVSLSFEGRRQDRYKRTLAQVWVHGSHDEPHGRAWLQRSLIRNGYARAYTLPGNGACLPALMAAEADARAAKRGLWGQGLYTVHRAKEDVPLLLRRVGRFAVVQGRVAEVSRAQRTTYINFGDDWRRDFTASLASALVDRDEGGAARASALVGKEIRVRGWIERRNGPMIVLNSLDEVEVLDEVDKAARP